MVASHGEDSLSVLLLGVIGSTAYGLAGPDSDVDRLGIFAVPTVELHGLERPPESSVTYEPDVTLHEAAKFCRLALAGNPTVAELLWLPDQLYEVRTPLGAELIALRHCFLSAGRVRAAYLGYAGKQLRLLANRRSGPDPRVAKHARHLMRLCRQGLAAYRTGEIPVVLDDPQSYHDFGARVAAGDVEAARSLLAEHEAGFATTTTPLPTTPDIAPVEAWLRRVRQAYL
ncbi:nucleotidyltransferase domain-containing protein [Asanoa sp. WMMD1127]|uniref:nucleotidyltransferase domain-containing protein n=1 Tax=Asanoa sp. WMMD1127 TaxID=3016107 RepID=UPI002416286B|nr:nucleotidyltransferase domain-containing protein [Asanoa sp. WMMD1127]MDG4820347.1 nucleotidyltransferase domain-containing protein [Asanoa sp. WMMD1127]